MGAKITEITREILENPQIFAIGRLMPHSDHQFFKNSEMSKRDRVNLNGTWKFRYAEDLSVAPKDFSSIFTDISDWEDITVPNHQEMCGYGDKMYVNVCYPWEGHEALLPGQIPQKVPVCTYVADVELKRTDWYISLQGVEPAFSIWVNGQFVGYSEDSFTPSEFDLGPFLGMGINRIAVQVYRYCSGSWLEDQDFFRFSGIFRDIYLYRKPAVHVEDLFVHTSADGINGKTSRKAHVDIDLQVSKSLAELETCRAEYIVLSPDGNQITRQAGKLHPVMRESKTVSAENLLSPTVYTDRISFDIENAMLWSAESPYLYDFILRLYDIDGFFSECVLQKIGIRTIDITDSILRVNEKRIVFRGVDRHEFCAESGRVVSKETELADVENMKRNNINAVRTSHYPNQTVFYDLCDMYGLYLIDEANMETHGAAYCVCENRDKYVLPGDRPEWQAALYDRANSMLMRDKNHPSVILWSCGNESGGGLDIYNMSNLFRKKDPSRKVHYEGVVHDEKYAATTDVVSYMYSKVDDIRKVLKDNRKKPFILCEYEHSMGNSTGNFDEYQALTREDPLFQGGFIWDYVDQSLYKEDPFGNRFLAYGGDFADRPNDDAFSGDGIMFADRTPSSALVQVKHDYSPFLITVDADRFTMTNLSSFEDTSDYALQIILMHQGREVKKQEGPILLAPGEKKTFLLPFNAAQIAKENADGEYMVRICVILAKDRLYAKKGHEIVCAESQGYGEYCYESLRKVTSVKASLHIEDGAWQTGVWGEGFHYIFDKFNRSKSLISAKLNGAEYLMYPPKPVFWRAPVQNDYGYDIMNTSGIWKLITESLGYEFKGMKVSADKSAVIMSYDCVSSYAKGPVCSVDYAIAAGGDMYVGMNFAGKEDMPPVPVIGMQFILPVTYSELEWYGRGVWENYPDRKTGCPVGIYTKKVTECVEPYLLPQESGLHTDIRSMKVMDESGKGLAFCMSDSYLSICATPYLSSELETARHHYELPRPYQTVVRVSGFEQGIGGDDSWGAKPHDKYLLPSDRDYSFEFRITRI